MSRSYRGHVGLAFLLAVTGGCGSPALFEARTVIHSDGSCERTIWQPEGEMLPAEATQPSWKARWKTVAAAQIPPAFAKDHQPGGDHHYFTAQGSFRKPEEIPAHFRHEAMPGPELGASELRHAYERKSFGFVVEHRWRETLTNIVTREGFLKARDQFLDLALPRVVEGLEQVYGQAYDVKRLAHYLRGEGRHFLEEAALVYYDVTARHLSPEAQTLEFAKLARRFGLDLFDSDGKLMSGEGAEPPIKSFFRHRIALGIRHRDGRRLTGREIEEILATGERSRFTVAWETYWKEREKQLEAELGPAILRMTGLYNGLFFTFGPRSPQFAFELALPGVIVETNGTLLGPGQASWRFCGDDSFPDGYVMTARSLEFDFKGQIRLLGRVRIDDPEKAEAYLAIVGRDGPLQEAVTPPQDDGDLRRLAEFVPRTEDEVHGLGRLRRLFDLEK